MTFRSISVRVHRVRGTNLGCNAVCCKLYISQRLLSETRTNEKRYVLTFSRPRFYATSFCSSRVTAQSSMETSFVSYNFLQIIVVAGVKMAFKIRVVATLYIGLWFQACSLGLPDPCSADTKSSSTGLGWYRLFSIYCGWS